jgi:hypothetical protein
MAAFNSDARSPPSSSTIHSDAVVTDLAKPHHVAMTQMTPNPYAAPLGGREPIDALADTPSRIRTLVEGWTDDRFERSYAEGKWTARQILIHLAQTELALPTRARYALSQDNYAAQSFAQDEWMPLDSGSSARTALDAYLALRQMNLGMWRALTPSQRERTFTHPEYGPLNVWWIAAQMAGHDLHHYKQLQAIGGA